MHKEASAQVPIFDTTQMGYLSIVGTWTLLPFSGFLSNFKYGYFGVSHRTFDFRQQLPSGEYSFVQYRILGKHRTCETCALILAKY